MEGVKARGEGRRSAETKDVIKDGCLKGRRDLVDSKAMVDEASVKRITETIAEKEGSW